MEIVFFPDLSNLLLEFNGSRFFKNEANGSEAICRFKWQLHVALVIIIHHSMSLVVFFQKIKERDGGI